jgi:hypothetical protein
MGVLDRCSVTHLSPYHQVKLSSGVYYPHSELFQRKDLWQMSALSFRLHYLILGGRELLDVSPVNAYLYVFCGLGKFETA